MAILNPDALVAPTDVRDIIDTDLEDEQIHAAINAAHLTAMESGASDDVSPELHMEIERYLAAHFITVIEGQVKSKGLKDVSVTFMGQDGIGLLSSRYGQNAVAMDKSGHLATLAEGQKKASIGVWRRRGMTYDG